jgi:phage terminase large subunit
MAEAPKLILLPYAPRRLQLEIHNALGIKRFGVIVCHRRFGKTVMAVNQLVRSAIECQRERPRFGYVAPTYRQAKAVAWDYLKHYTAGIPGMDKNEVELRVDLPGGRRIQLFGADNPDSLRGLYFDGLAIDEFGMMGDGRIWSEVLLPTLSDRQGYAMFIGTPNGKNAFWDIRNHAASHDDWLFANYKASQTGIISADELKLAKSLMTKDEYDQEYECSFEASVRGAIFGEELAAARDEGRVGKVPHDPAVSVDTFWDLGVGPNCSIWFTQSVASEIRVIDYYQGSRNDAMPQFASVIKDKPYNYRKHWAPHDIEVKEFGSGRSRIETAASLGIKFLMVPRAGSGNAEAVEERIHASKMVFSRCWFDEQRCQLGLEGLANVRRD